MPLVFITIPNNANTEPDTFGGFTMEKFAQHVQQCVADALTCQDTGGQLTKDEVEVEIKQRQESWFHHYVGGEKAEVRIVVLANDFPARRANLKRRNRQLLKKVSEFSWNRKVSGYVWIRLAPAEFGTF